MDGTGKGGIHISPSLTTPNRHGRGHTRDEHHHDQVHGHHHHGHHHDEAGVFHTHASANRMRRAFLLTLVILAAEVTGGYLSHSLALMSDAGHVLTDVAAIGLSWYALRQAEKPSNSNMTFGYMRSGILAALANGLALILITVWILFEAYRRFSHPVPVHGAWMFGSAVVGLCLNLYLGLGMRHDEDLNVRSAVLHMLGDAAASAGVIVAGCIILFTHWYVLDPILSVLIALLIASGAWRIVHQTVLILMEGTPHGVDFNEVVKTIKSVPSVSDVHDVHIWTITSGRNALSCHIVVDGDMSVHSAQALLRDIEHRLVHMGIGHVTVQTEDPEHPHEAGELCCQPERLSGAHSD